MKREFEGGGAEMPGPEAIFPRLALLLAGGVVPLLIFALLTSGSDVLL